MCNCKTIDILIAIRFSVIHLLFVIGLHYSSVDIFPCVFVFVLGGGGAVKGGGGGGGVGSIPQ